MTKISDLTALTGAGVDTAADLLPIVDMSAAGAARNKKITVDEARIGLGLGTAASPQFAGINLGHASDTTITRVSAGVVAVEGVNVVTTAGGVTFAADIVVPDEAYDATAWNGSLEVPTKNAIRDKIESLAPLSISVDDEGSTLTSGLTSLDFVGAGVTATNVGGDVTVTIAGGGGYNAENARDDVGAALVEGAGVDITIDDGADTITIASGVWRLAGTGQTATGVWDFAVDGAKANVDFVGLSSYNELLIILDAVTGSAGTANRTLRLSTDNGSTFYTTSGDYVDFGASGVVTNRAAGTFLSGATASAASMLIRIGNMKGAVKSYTSSGAVLNGLFRASASDLNAVRITSTTADTLNGGKIYVYGR